MFENIKVKESAGGTFCTLDDGLGFYSVYFIRQDNYVAYIAPMVDYTVYMPSMDMYWIRNAANSNK